ncbi:MAG: hypothetical protein ACSLFM_00350 [Tepidiformaceae bacterium]
MSDSQRALLADGELSFADYESSVLLFAQCVQEAGIRFDNAPVYNKGNRRFEYTIQLGASDAAAQESDAVVNKCFVAHLVSIQSLWNRLNQPTESDLIEANEAWMACLEEQGLDTAEVPAWGSPEWETWVGEHLRAEAVNPSVDVPAWRRCLGLVGDEFPSG